jgi:hypothetical protein
VRAKLADVRREEDRETVGRLAGDVAVEEPFVSGALDPVGGAV